MSPDLALPGAIDLSRLTGLVVDLVTDKATEVAAPPADLGRSHHALAIDPFHRELYVFGGRQGDAVLGDLWVERPLAPEPGPGGGAP